MKKSLLLLISISSLYLLSGCANGGGSPPPPPPPPPPSPSAVPFINQPLSPDAVMPGGAGFTLTVNGTGFVSGSMVNWNGSALTTTVVSGSKLTASVLASEIANAGTASVTVVNPAPGGGKSNVVLFEVTHPVASVSLNTSSQLAAGSAPSAVATGDFNGDGKLDLVVANEGSDNVSVFLSKGDGTFQPAVNYSVASTPVSVAVGDFNGDGKLDLAVVNNLNDNVNVLLGNGDGTFRPAVNYGVASTPQSVAVGDLNGDGKLDLVVTNGGSSTVSVLLGNGDGTFQRAVDYGVGGDPFSVAVGDFNGDGKLDLVVANLNSRNLSVLLGKGDGTFQAAVNYDLALFSPYSVAVGDFNGDGKLDLAVAGQRCQRGCPILHVLLGNGDGTFQSPNGFLDSTQNGTTFVTVGDFNGDGKLDVAVTDFQTFTTSVFLGTGTGVFGTPVNYSVVRTPGGIGVGDFNGDGKLDLAVTSSAGVSIMLQQ